MRLNKFSKLAVLALSGGLVLGSGCSFNGLARNIWTGFGLALGGIPANLVSDLFLTNFLNTGDNADGA